MRQSRDKEYAASPLASPGIIRWWRVLPYRWLIIGAVATAAIVLLLMLIPPDNTPSARVAESLPFNGGCPGESDDEGDISSWLWLGDPAPDFSAYHVDGRKFAASEYIGSRAVWLSFLSSGYKIDNAQLAEMNQAYQAYDVRGLELIALVVGDEPLASLNRSSDQVESWVLGRDIAYDAATRYCVDAFPTHVFVDSAGTVRRILIGHPSPGQISQALERITSQ